MKVDACSIYLETNRNRGGCPCTSRAATICAMASWTLQLCGAGNIA
jgi:hypothetical protein